MGFVFPSIYDGFGIPVLEAMQAGCPVLSSNIPSLVEVIGHGGLFFSPNDYTEMNKAYTMFFNSRDSLPSRSTFAGSGLALGAKIEIECWATK